MPASHPRLNLRSASQEQFHRRRIFSCYWRQAKGDNGGGAPSSVATASGTLVSDWEKDNPQQEQTSEQGLVAKESSSRNGASSEAAIAVAPPNASFMDFPVQAAALAAGMASPPPRMIEESQQRIHHRKNEHREVPGIMKQSRNDQVTIGISSNGSQHRDQPQAMTFEEFREMKRLLNNQPKHFNVQNPSSSEKKSVRWL